MDEALNKLFGKNQLKEHCHTCFDINERNFQYYKKLPKFTQKRIYFEYWFLSNMVLSKQITLEMITQECLNIGWNVNDDEIIRLVTSITTNGCVSITTPTISRNMHNTTTILQTDFIYFNSANPTYKVGRILTDEIFKWMNDADDDIAMRIVTLSQCLNEILKKILKNNSTV